MPVSINRNRPPVWGDDFDLDCTLIRSDTQQAEEIDENTVFSLSFRSELELEDDESELYLTSDDEGVFTVVEGVFGKYSVHVAAASIAEVLSPETPYHFRLRVQNGEASPRTHVSDVVLFTNAA